MDAAKGTAHAGKLRLGMSEKYQNIQVDGQSTRHGVEGPHGKPEKDDRKRAKLSCGLFSEPQTDTAQAIASPPGDPQNRHPPETYPPAAISPSTGVPSAASSGMDPNNAPLPPLIQSEEADLAEPPSRRHRSSNPLKRLLSKSFSKLWHRSLSQPPSPERISSAGGAHKLFGKSRSASQPPPPERGSFPPPHRGWFSKSSKKGNSLPTTPTGKGHGKPGSHGRRASGYYYQVDIAPSLSPIWSWLPTQDAQSESPGASIEQAEGLPTIPRGADYGARGPPWSAPTTPQSHEVIQWSGPSTPAVTETPPSSGPSSPVPTGEPQWNAPGSSAGAETLPQSAPGSPTGESTETFLPVPHRSPSQQSSWQMYGDPAVVTSSPISQVLVQGGTSPSLEDPLVFEVPVLGLPQGRREELPTKLPPFSGGQELGEEGSPSPISVIDRRGYESPSVQDGVTVLPSLEEIHEDPTSESPSEYEDTSDVLRTAGSGITDETAGGTGVENSRVEGGEEGIHTGRVAVSIPVTGQTVKTTLRADDETGTEPEQAEPEERGAREVKTREVFKPQDEKGLKPSEHGASGEWKDETVAGSEPQNEKGIPPSDTEETGRSGLRTEGRAESSKLPNETETGALEFGERDDSGVRKDKSPENLEPQNETGTRSSDFEERGGSVGWTDGTGGVFQLQSGIGTSGKEGAGRDAWVVVPASSEELGAGKSGTGGAGGLVAEGKMEAVSVPGEVTLQETDPAGGGSRDSTFRSRVDHTDDESGAAEVTGGAGEDELRKSRRVSAGIQDLVSFFEAEASRLLGTQPTGRNGSPEKSKRPETEAGPVGSELESAVPQITGTEQNGTETEPERNGTPVEEVASQQPASLERESGLSVDAPPFEKGPEGAAEWLGAPQPAEPAEPAEPLSSVDLNFGCLLGAYRAQQTKRISDVAPTAEQEAPLGSGEYELERLPADSVASPGGGTRPEFVPAVDKSGAEERNGTVVDGKGGAGAWEGAKGSGMVAEDGDFGASGMVGDGFMKTSGTAEREKNGGTVEGEEENGKVEADKRSGTVKVELQNGTVGGEKTSHMIVGEKDRETVGGEEESKTLDNKEETGTLGSGTTSGAVAVKSAADGNSGGFETTVDKEKIGRNDCERGGKKTGFGRKVGSKNEALVAERSGMAEGTGCAERTGIAKESGEAKENGSAEASGTAEASGRAEQRDTPGERNAAEKRGSAEKNGTADANGTAIETGTAEESKSLELGGTAKESEIAEDNGIAEEIGTVGKAGTRGEKETAEVKGTEGLDGTRQEKNTGAEYQTVDDNGTDFRTGAEFEPTGDTGTEDEHGMTKEKGAGEETGASVESGDGIPSESVGGDGIARDASLDSSPEAPMGAGVGAPRSSHVEGHKESHVEGRKESHVDSQEGQIGELEEDVESTGATGGATKDDVTDDASSRRRRPVRWGDDVSTGARESGERAPDSDPGPARGRNATQARPTKAPPHPVIQIVLVGGILGKAAVKTGVGLTYITLQQCGVLAKATTNLVLEDAKGVVGTLAKQAGRMIDFEKRAQWFG